MLRLSINKSCQVVPKIWWGVTSSTTLNQAHWKHQWRANEPDSNLGHGGQSLRFSSNVPADVIMREYEDKKLIIGRSAGLVNVCINSNLDKSWKMPCKITHMHRWTYMVKQAGIEDWEQAGRASDWDSWASKHTLIRRPPSFHWPGEKRQRCKPCRNDNTKKAIKQG